MSKKGNVPVIVVIVILIVLLVGGAVWYKKQARSGVTAPGTSAVPAGQTGKAGTPSGGTTETFNDGLDQDSKSVDSQLNALGNDASGLDQSLKETPTSDLTQ